MKVNYHSHTTRCRHAVGEDREYVEAAIKNGLSALGFSDHVPYPVPDFEPKHRMRMKCEETEDYVTSVLSLRDEYKDDIEIKLGFEAEYFPAYFDGLRKFLSQFPVDYLILGEHFIPSESDGIYVGVPNKSSEDLILYADLVCEAVKTGLFTYVAHPDVFHYVGEDAGIYKAQLTRIALAAKEADIPLEYNLLGMMTKRYYPCDILLSVAKEVGNKVILGSDSHDPQWCGNRDIAAEGTANLAKYGIVPVEDTKLIKPEL